MANPRPLSIRLAALLLTVALPAGATTIVVTTTADELTIDGTCSLREAVIAANTDAPFDACPAGSGADTIVLHAGTYRLTRLGNGEDASQTGDLDVHSTILISGAGAATTSIEGADRSAGLLRDRVIHVSPFGSLTLSQISIRGGYCARGGGLFNDGELHVLDSRVEGNVTSEESACPGPIGGWGGAGILNASAGWLTMSRSVVSGNEALGIGDRRDFSSSLGGGLTNYGVASIGTTVFSGNFAAAGGAIVNVGGLEVGTSQVSANYSRFRAAAVLNFEDSSFVRTTFAANVGGSVIENGTGNTPARLLLTNSTVSGNVSHYSVASLYNQAGLIEVTSSTITGNWSPNGAAGLGGAGSIVLTDSIVFNRPADGHLNQDCQAPVLSHGHNIDGDGSCGLSEEAGDLPNTDPHLGPLADYGGPTPTHALLNGSPAIDHIAGSQCSVTIDQRGVARAAAPKPGACDVGAYEFSPADDVERIGHGVLQLSQLDLADRLILMQPLKQALFAVSRGDAPGACVALDSFAAAVSGYAGGGQLSEAQAGALQHAAYLLRGVLCPA